MAPRDSVQALFLRSGALHAAGVLPTSCAEAQRDKTQREPSYSTAVDSDDALEHLGTRRGARQDVPLVRGVMHQEQQQQDRNSILRRSRPSTTKAGHAHVSPAASCVQSL